MSGVLVVRSLLAAYGALTAVVPAARIKSGLLPIGSYPAIGVTLVVGDERNTVAMPASGRMMTDHVRVSWMVAGGETGASNSGYAMLRQIGALVLAACPHQRGTIESVKVDSILPSGIGPDLATDAPVTLSASRDFIVRWIG